MTLKFACPGCGIHVVLDSSAGISKMKCPGCGIDFPVPQLISPTPPPVPPPLPPPASASPPFRAAISLRKETSIIPVMLSGLAIFFGILAVWFVLGTVIPNFKAGREESKRRMREQSEQNQANEADTRLAPEIIQPTQAEADSVKISYPKLEWRSYGTADGDVLIINCPIDNPTRYKLINMTLSVRCFDHSDKLVRETTRKRLTDVGMDFAPPGQLKNLELMAELGSIPASSVTRLEVTIGEFQCTIMTDLDTRLTNAQELLKQFKTRGQDGVPPEQAEAFKEFLRLLEEKRKLTGH